MVASLCAVPSSALVLEGVTHGGDPEVVQLRRAIAAVMPGEGCDAHVVVVAVDPAVTEPSGVVQVVAPDQVVHLGGLGRADLRASVAPSGVRDPAVLTHPGPDLAVLAMLAHQFGAEEVSLIGLSAAPAATALDDAAVALASLIAGGRAVVVAADLTPCHGTKPPRPDLAPQRAAAFDRAVMTGLHDPAMLDDLQPEAHVLSCRGLPTLRLAARIARHHGLGPGPAHRTIAGGVSGLVCAWQPL
ncbi:MAG: hypothetical protein ACR2HR_09125 [Euzebya sp.]